MWGACIPYIMSYPSARPLSWRRWLGTKDPAKVGFFISRRRHYTPTVLQALASTLRISNSLMPSASPLA